MTVIEPQIRYLKPGWATRNVMNRAIRRLLRLGVSVWGARELGVRGRRSGELRTTVVNVLDFEDRRYLVAPRGTTQWVRNLRAAGDGELRVGRRAEAFSATELDGIDKLPVLRAYLGRWKWEVGQFFDGVDGEASDEALAGIADGHPVFLIRTREG